ncbi:MAG TPA: hypothetical protein VHD91_07725 [Gaiellaceae bacterium]|nr:hypothetical protein [Gaiellaceae bacterium]
MFDPSVLIDYVTRQRWYGSKSRTVVDAQVLDTVEIRSTEPTLSLALVELRYDTGVHDLYQLLVTATGDDVRVDGLAEEPGLARELVSAIRGGLTVQGDEGMLEFRAAADYSPLAQELDAIRLISSEQSNTSVVFGDALIMKLFRRVEPGINPELEMLSFLCERDYPNVPALGGWYSYSGGPLAATLGILQEFVAGGEDGWELALVEIGDAPERFLDRLARLGEVTGELHSALGSDPSDSAFASEEPSPEALGLLTAQVDEEIARVFLDLPEGDEQLEPIVGRGEEVREQLRQMTHAGSVGRVIRTHGDYHLGQTLVVGEDWVILDFEGEPARPLAERRRKRSPLRDVASMLRSFAYAASAARIVRGVEVADDWEERARDRFLSSYLDTVDPTLIPSGQAAIERLLGVFELEKAVYELRYELDNRPDWVKIPVAGIQRLIETAAAA